MKYEILQGDVVEMLKTLQENSVDSIVTDPPYELSNDGKHSPSRVALEFMFPQDAKIESTLTGEDRFPHLIREILRLGSGSVIPTPSSTVPVSSVTFDQNITDRDENIKYAGKGAVGVAKRKGLDDSESKIAKHLGNFIFKLTDPTSMLNAFNSTGTGFDSGSLRIGLSVSPASLVSFLHGSGSINLRDHDIGLGNNSLSDFVSALSGAAIDSMLSLNLSRRAVESISTYGALKLLSVLHLGGAKLIAAFPATSSLPSKFESRRICVVNHATNRTLSFNLVIVPQNISSAGFMGKDWDGSKIAYDVGVWSECLRVLKPGGYLLSFGGSRTYHRMASAIEDAGFEIRDQIMWLYGSGFPKSLDVSKAIDKSAGSSREVVGIKPGHEEFANRTTRGHIEFKDATAGFDRPWMHDDEARARYHQLTAPATDEAKQWDGWGTALKPAHEPIVLARKPLIGTVVENVLKYSTGALNIDACRVPGESVPINRLEQWSGFGQEIRPDYVQEINEKGRWPANLLHDGSDEVLVEFAKYGITSSVTGMRGIGFTGADDKIFGKGNSDFDTLRGHNDSGSPARFFYCAKASKEDRSDGCEELPEVRRSDGRKTEHHVPNLRTTARTNHHPTVKPNDLMRYLCKMITPPGGKILDCFMGSGSTGKAALMEGFDFVGIEKEEEYCTIAKARMEHVLETHLPLFRETEK